MTTTDQLDARIEDLRRQLAEAEAERERQVKMTPARKAADEFILPWGSDRYITVGTAIVAPHPHAITRDSHVELMREQVADLLQRFAGDAAARPASPAPADLPSAEDMAGRMVPDLADEFVHPLDSDRSCTVRYVMEATTRVCARKFIADGYRTRDAYWQAKVAEAVKAEREACAKVVDRQYSASHTERIHLDSAARAIRARND